MVALNCPERFNTLGTDTNGNYIWGVLREGIVGVTPMTYAESLTEMYGGADAPWAPIASVISAICSKLLTE